MEQVFFIADFHLGDLMAYRGETGENLLSRLPGKKYLIEGNHDENLRAFPGQFRSVELMMNKVFSPMVYPFLKERLNVTMCHYPMYSWYRKLIYTTNTVLPSPDPQGYKEQGCFP